MTVSHCIFEPQTELDVWHATGYVDRRDREFEHSTTANRSAAMQGGGWVLI